MESKSESSSFEDSELESDDSDIEITLTLDTNPDGTIELRLRNNIRVLITLDQAFLVHDLTNKIKISISNDMKSSALQHPNGRVYQSFNQVGIVAHDARKRNNFVRYAKMYENGIGFTTDDLIYLINERGLHFTKEPVQLNMQTDYCNHVFTKNSKISRYFVPAARNIVKSYKYSLQKDGSEIFEINGLLISQATNGSVGVYRQKNCWIKTSPVNGSVNLTTPSLNCSALMEPSAYLVVSHETSRVNFDGFTFNIRIAGNAASFDDNNYLTVY